MRTSVTEDTNMLNKLVNYLIASFVCFTAIVGCIVVGNILSFLALTVFCNTVFGILGALVVTGVLLFTVVPYTGMWLGKHLWDMFNEHKTKII